LAIATDSDDGQAPAIGAIRIGTRSPNLSQKTWARASAGCVWAMTENCDRIARFQIQIFDRRDHRQR
jgi:hypothetical protein